MTIQGKFCPHCNKEGKIIDPKAADHAAQGGRMSCNLCKAALWVFTPSDVLFLEAWGIAAEVTYDYVAVPT